jgi:hypothetical protein
VSVLDLQAIEVEEQADGALTGDPSNLSIQGCNGASGLSVLICR